MLKIEDVIKDLNNLDVEAFAQLSDMLWKLGNLDDIKEKVIPELFTLHIGINMIGIWKSVSTVSGTIKTNLSKFYKKLILFICFFECQAPMFPSYKNA